MAKAPGQVVVVGAGEAELGGDVRLAQGPHRSDGCERSQGLERMTGAFVDQSAVAVRPWASTARIPGERSRPRCAETPVVRASSPAVSARPSSRAATTPARVTSANKVGRPGQPHEPRDARPSPSDPGRLLTGKPHSANPAGGGPLAISKRHRRTPVVGDPAGEVLVQ